MTRLEKNRAKRNYKRSIILCYSLILLFFILMTIAGIFIRTHSTTVIFIVLGVVISPLFFSVSSAMYGSNYLSDIREYKTELVQKRNDVLEKMVIETLKGDLSDKNVYNKVINMYNAMSFIDYKSFIKDYIIATYKNSPNSKLKEFVEEKLADLLNNN